MAIDKKKLFQNIVLAGGTTIVLGIVFAGAGPTLGALLPILGGAASFAGFGIIRKPRDRVAYVPRTALPAPEKPPSTIEDAQEDVRRIGAVGGILVDGDVKDQVEKLHQTGTQIVDYLAANPTQVPLARKFLTYYLDTARKTLERYQKFGAVGIDSDDVRRIRLQTEEALPGLNEAFKEELEKLLASEILDTEADLKLLETDRRLKGGL